MSIPAWAARFVEGLESQDWMTQARCAQTDPEAFFPEGKGKGNGPAHRTARRVCLACPVESECLDYALIHDERFGIWGNTTPKQREAIRRRLGYTTTTPTTDEGPEPA